MPRLPSLKPQFKLSKNFFLHPLLSSNTNTQNPGPAPGFLLPFVSRLGLGFSSSPPLQQYVVTVILGDVIRFVVPFDRVRGTTARACQVWAPLFQDRGQRVGVAGAGDGAFTAAELCCVICLSPRAGTQGASSLIHVWAPPLLYGLELHHLNLNGIQHIAGFITFCKGFLGMESHYELWMYFFSLSPFKRTNNVLLPPMGCGSIHLTGKHVGEYMKLVLSGSNKGWQGHWFYFKNDTAASFHPYSRRTLDCHSAP
jgi:hypothetical protein